MCICVCVLPWEPADLVKNGFRASGPNRKKKTPEIGPEIGPAWKIGKNWEKLGSSGFWAISSLFSRRGQFRDQSRELFFSYFGPEARNPFFTRSAGSQCYLCAWLCACLSVYCLWASVCVCTSARASMLVYLPACLFACVFAAARGCTYVCMYAWIYRVFP